MFQRAKLFKEKYALVAQAQDAATLLAQKHEELTNRVSKLKHEILTLESEYEILDSDLNEFLMQYYEKFQVYRKLVKRVHPDLNAEGSVRDVSLVNGLYEKSDLEGLLSVQTELDNQEIYNVRGEGLVREIELMESQGILMERRYSKVKIKLQRITGSPEYKLYTRYKIAEMQNIDFFDQLLKEI